jgi:hypothetical protein
MSQSFLGWKIVKWHDNVLKPKYFVCLELTIFSCKHLFNVHTIFVAIVSIADLRVVTFDIAILPSTSVRWFQLIALMSITLLLSSLLGFVSALRATVVAHMVAPLYYACHHHGLYSWKYMLVGLVFIFYMSISFFTHTTFTTSHLEVLIWLANFFMHI